MPTSFVAVQCFECSTMQVKQQKKSSNKWSCVVCNQKQSVRKVFSQSFMAKDVRKFVQSFNMSRQLLDEKQSLSIHDPQIDESPGIEQKKRKRNDWTEYIDDDREEHGRKFEDVRSAQGGDEDDSPVIVTEMPKAKAAFVKPKLKESSCSRFSALKKPSFPNRRTTKSNQNAHSNDMEGDFSRDSSQNLKWNSFMAQVRDNCIEKQPFVDNQPTQVIKNANCSNAGQKVSKWSSFITEDDDYIDGHKFEDRENRDDSMLSINDERVEEDIHPDFL